MAIAPKMDEFMPVTVLNTRLNGAEDAASRVQQTGTELAAERDIELRQSRIEIRRDVPPARQRQRLGVGERRQEHGDHRELIHPGLEPVLIAQDQPPDIVL